MSRRLPDLPYDYPNALIVGGLAVVVCASLALAVVVDRQDRQQEKAGTTGVDCWDDASCAATEAGYVVLDPAVIKGTTAYEACLLASRHPQHGYAGEVCEPLSPHFEPGQYVYAGPDSWVYQGATVAVPALPEQVADSCADTADLAGCVRALLDERQEHPR